MIRLALSDLDDTLIAFGEPQATRRSREAIHAMLDAGLRFAPVTGRLPVDMEWMFDGDEACYATGAFANGQIVRVDGKTVHAVYIERALLEDVEKCLDSMGGDAYLCLYDPWVPEEIAYVTTRPEALLANPPETYGSITKIVPRVSDFPASNDDPTWPAYAKANIQCACPLGELPGLRDHLRDLVPGVDFMLPSSKAHVIDILPLGWGKADGVRELMGATGLCDCEVVAFGDSENDLPMMRAVTNSVAVANASDQVKDVARWHIGACEDGAVDDALRDIVLANAEGRLPSFMEGES